MTDPHPSTKNGVVVAGASGSSAAGLRMLEAGGNAVDAGVATVLALSVTDDDQFCFGGEVPMLIHMSGSDKVVAICGQGPAPRDATLEAFKGLKVLPRSGIRSAAVPSALATCLLALDQFGTRTFADVASPTLELLNSDRRAWFPRLANTIKRLIQAESSAAGGRSAGIEAVRKAFYEGPIAEELVAWSCENGGLLSIDDMSAFRARVEEPVHGTYRGIDVYKCGFWTQGPSLIQALNILEDYDLGAMNIDEPDYIHLIVETIKLAFADRDTYYADPDFEDIPAEALLSKDYAAIRRTLLNRTRASLEYQPGDPIRNAPLTAVPPTQLGIPTTDSDTTTCTAGDRFGNMFVATPSGWGSGVEPGTTGVEIGTRLISANLWPGHPNVLAPGKRPRITLTPTLAMQDGRPFMTVSIAGGDQQEQTALQTVVNVIDLKMGAQHAADATRYGTSHHIGSFQQSPVEPGSLLIERSSPSKTVAALRGKGHDVEILDEFPSRMVLIRWDKDGSMTPGADLQKTRTIAQLR